MRKPEVDGRHKRGQRRRGGLIERGADLWAMFLSVVLVGSMLSAAPASPSSSGIDVAWQCEGVSVTSPTKMSKVVVARGNTHTQHSVGGEFAWSLGKTPGITTIWVSTRGNNSGDGPGYGERFNRPSPDPCGPANRAPVADAGDAQTGVVGQAVTLDGTGSTDPDGDTLSYSWTLSGPTGSTATLDDSAAAQPVFTPDAAGDYTATLVVNDGTTNSAIDTVTISVASANQIPVADAGDDLTAAAGDVVSLDGTGSTDPDGDSLSYSWTLTGPTGSSATLDDSTYAEPAFTADLAGAYTATLVVSDGTDDSPADSVTITVTHRPVADAGSDQDGVVGQPVALDATGSSDLDADILTHSWTLSGPTGTTASLDDDTSATPTFTPDLAGEYIATLTVSDGTYSAIDTVTITVTPANQLPVADAGTDQLGTTGQLVTLD